MTDVPEAEQLNNLFIQHLNVGVADVNDGEDCSVFPQEHPKYRVLAGLEKIKCILEEKTEKKVEKTVYVAVPASIIKQTEELVLS